MTDPGRTPDALRAEYLGRINRVVDHIERNLHRSLRLEELAEVAHFSPYHFHRIFGAMIGETLSRFIQRLRIERAAAMLVTNPGHSITEIAIDCGFSSSATFARAFKDAFGMSGTQWREHGNRKNCQDHRKIRKRLDKLRKAEGVSDCYLDPRTNVPTWRIEMPSSLATTIQVKHCPDHRVAYIRHVGPYGQAAVVPRLFSTLREWAIPRGLLDAQTRFLLVAHDNPTITDEDKLRLSVCLTVPADTKPEGEVSMMTIPGGTFAVGRFEIPPERIADAWNVVMGEWMPGSGFQPDDRLCYEEALNDPRQHPEGKIILDICVPVRS